MGFAPIKWTCTVFFRPRQLTDRAIVASRQTQEKHAIESPQPGFCSTCQKEKQPTSTTKNTNRNEQPRKTQKKISCKTKTALALRVHSLHQHSLQHQHQHYHRQFMLTGANLRLYALLKALLLPFQPYSKQTRKYMHLWVAL